MTASDYEILANFRYELRKFLRFSEQQAKAHGVASAQYLAMLAIEGAPIRLSVGNLAERLQVAHHSAVGLVDRLEALKYVRRIPSSEDHRQVHVTLTTKGRAKLAKLAAVHREELQTAGPRLVRELSRITSSTGG